MAGEPIDEVAEDGTTSISKRAGHRNFYRTIALAVGILQAEVPGCQVIVLTTLDDERNAFKGLQAAAIGYLPRDVTPEKFLEVIRLSARGKTLLQPSIVRKVVAEFANVSEKTSQDHQLQLESLSEREREVLQLVSEGASNKEIAIRLFIAPGTVKNHITNILSKLGVRDRTQAALKGRDLNLL